MVMRRSRSESVSVSVFTGSRRTSTPADRRVFGSASGLFLAGCRNEGLAESVAARRMSSCRTDCKAAIRVVQRQCEQSHIHVIISHRAVLLLPCLPTPSPIHHHSSYPRARHRQSFGKWGNRRSCSPNNWKNQSSASFHSPLATTRLVASFRRIPTLLRPRGQETAFSNSPQSRS